MDQTQLQAQIAQYYNKLPPKIQKVFADMQWIEVLQELGVTYSLKKEQTELLNTETTLALLGIIDSDEYRTNILKELNVPKETQEKIFSDLYEKIFKPISEDLTNAYNTNVTDIILEDTEDLPLPPSTENIEDDIPVPVPAKAPKTSQVGIFKDAGIEMMETPVNPIEAKMSGMTVSKKSVKDYTLPKMGGRSLDDHPKTGDPYHEQV